MGGTQTARDVWDDLKIPFGLTRYSKRYIDADKVLQQDPNINKLVGHSLGGAVALEFQKNYPERNFQTITYGAPVNSDNHSNERFRKDGYIFSFLDSGAQSYNKLTPDVGQHSYRGYILIIK
jgi:pimeloyl-ACP methyl ester carboxylesterase